MLAAATGGSRRQWGAEPAVWLPGFYHHHDSQIQCPLQEFPSFSIPPGTLSPQAYQLPYRQSQGQQRYQHQHNLHQVSSPQYQSTMAEPSELEQMQRLSETYNPNLPGPLVGDKKPLLDLVTEYSQADPAFVLKTQALAATHSGYRQIKGDGQCGWRGAVFGYFELLLTLGDAQLLQQEEIRIQSFAELMKMAGIDYDIIVDMFDYTWELFADLKAAIDRGDKADSVLMKTMNDENISNSIVYHFKMMASAYMQLSAENYEPFLDMPVADYRVSRIDPSNQEIDQVGLQVMTDAVIAPAGFALVVLYLDRSSGDQATPHVFAPKNSGGPTIQMLYRPGHYDLIYSGVPSVQVYLQSETMVATDLQMSQPSRIPTDFQAYIFPHSTSSMTIPPMGSHASNGHLSSTSHNPFSHVDDTVYPVQRSISSLMSHPPLVPPVTQPYHTPSSQSCPSTLSSPHNPSSPLEIHNVSREQLPSPPTSISNLNQTSEGPRIRPTKYVMEYRLVGESVPLCNTVSGTAASLSTAHFQNEGFQPQIWKAEDEYLR